MEAKPADDALIKICRYKGKPVRIFNKNNTLWFILTDIGDKILKLGTMTQFFKNLDKKDCTAISLTNACNCIYSVRAVSKDGVLKLLDEFKNRKGVADFYKWIIDDTYIQEHEDNIIPPEREDNIPQEALPSNISEEPQKVAKFVETHIYKFDEHEIRMQLDEKGDPWFVAKDVCNAIDIVDNRDAVSRLDSDERGEGSTLTLGGVQTITLINESGLYNLILSSRKPSAKPFKRWVTHEVLPTIRRTGAYITDSKAAELKRAPEKGLELLNQVEQVKAEVTAPTVPADPIINLGPFLKKSCAYLFQLTINDIKYLKPGYTSDLIARIKSLRDTFGADPRLLCIRPASAENSEKEFHKLIKARYPELYPKIKINDKIKSELYLYDQRIIDEFNMFEFDITTPHVTQVPIETSVSINDEIRKLEVQAQLGSIALEKTKIDFKIMKWKKANGIPI